MVVIYKEGGRENCKAIMADLHSGFPYMKGSSPVLM